MSVRMVILGLLRAGPLHGYEIKRLIEERMGDWTAIAFGSIYFALDKLAEDALIEKVAEERAGGRPSRSVYAITPSGRDEFLRLLRGIWQEVERAQYAIDLGIFFMPALPRDEVIGYLRGRVDFLQHALYHVRDHHAETMAAEGLPPRVNAIFGHTLIHLEAELQWTKDVLAKMEGGEYV